jgi:inosine-uridine nucleoside N-ribohydrolase
MTPKVVLSPLGRLMCVAAVGLSGVVGAMSAAVGAAAAEPNLVIYDNDFSGPESADILPLIGDPSVKVVGFTVVTGDGWVDEETADLLRFLEIARRTDIAVVRGAVFPLVNSEARTRAWEQMYGKIVWKGAWNPTAPDNSFHPTEPYKIPPSPLGPPTTKAAPGTAADFLIRQVHLHPHQVTILAAGPLTNIALAIRLDPDFASLAKQLIFMGGFVDTNLAQVTDSANFATDFNIWFDPEAADIVLTAPWAKITSVGSVSNDIVYTPELAARIAARTTPVTQAVVKYALPLPLWDQITAAIAADPSLVTGEIQAYMGVDVDHGMYYGATHVWPDVTAPHLGEQKVHIVTAIDKTRFLDEFVRDAQAPVPGDRPQMKR